MIIRTVSLLAALLAGLIVFNPRQGIVHTLIWGQKLLASAFSPFLAMLGAAGALLGLIRRDYVSAGAGVIAAGIAAEHIAQVTASRDDLFAETFGPNWELQIPARIRPLLLRHRWQIIGEKRPCHFVHRNVVFGTNLKSGAPLRADILLPRRGYPRSGLAMVYVHGGGWWYGGKNVCKFPYFRQMASQGHVVMDVDYTLAPHSNVQQMVRDVKQAIVWLKQGNVRGVNPDRIVLGGQSAGAHLSLLAAYTPNPPELQPPGVAGDTSVRGVVSYYGPPDLAALHDDIQQRFTGRLPEDLVDVFHRLLKKVGQHGDSLARGIAAIIGGTPAELPDTYRLISPISHVQRNCPPTLLFQGTHDLMVDYRDVHCFYKKLRRAGAPVIYVSLPGCDHSFESIFPRWSPAAQTAAYYTERFLALLT